MITLINNKNNTTLILALDVSNNNNKYCVRYVFRPDNNIILEEL